MKTVLLLYFISLSFLVFAEKPRERYYFESKNKEFFLKQTHYSYDSIPITEGEFTYYKSINLVEIWTLFNRADSSELYSFNDTTLYYKTAVISNDGKSIIVINDIYPIEDKTPILRMYVNGKNSYGFNLFDLIDNYASCMLTLSGFSWSFDFYYDTLNPNIFVIKTFEFKEVKIDLISGQIISSVYFDHINYKTKILYGKVEGLGGNIYQIRVWTKINGKVSIFKPNKFYSEKKLNYGTQTVVLNNDKYDIRFDDYCIFLKYNMCDFKPIYRKN